MTSPKDLYITEIREAFGYTPAWLPNVKIDTGDIVVLDDRSPTLIGNIRKASYGMGLEIVEDDGMADLHHMSAEGVSISFKAAGSVPAPGSALAVGDAGVSIEFSRKNAVVLETLGCKTRRIADHRALGARILELYRADQWEKDWAVVTDVVHADSLTVFLSSASEAKVELKASGDFSAGGTSLASAKAQFAIVASKNVATQVVACARLTPFYKAYGVAGLVSKRWAQKASEDDGPQTLAELRTTYRSQMVFALIRA